MATEINIGAFLGTRAFLNPGKEALYDVASDRRFTFSELNTRANQASAALSALGLAKGDRVALLTYNGSEFVECFFGPAKTGLVIMPLNWRLTADELAFILKDGGARALVFDADFAPVIEQLKGMGDQGSDVEHYRRATGPRAAHSRVASGQEFRPSERPACRSLLRFRPSRGDHG